MKEVEVKYKVKSFRGVKSKLKELGFELVESEEFKDHYYTDKAGKFIKNETCLRLRKRGDKALLTYKPKTVRNQVIKSKTEVETMVDFKEMDDIIKRLGFPLAVKFNKSSEEYKKGRVTVSLDIVNGIKYVEVEVMAHKTKRAKERVKEVVEALGLKDREPRNYRDITMGYERY